MELSKIVNAVYYQLKPLMPRWFQLALRRKVVLGKQDKYKDVWPILEKAAKPPQNWHSWPEGKKFAIVLTHDVEKAGGHDKSKELALLEKKLGFRSAFYFVPERYRVSPELRHWLQAEGFEIGVHGLFHDGKLFQSRKIFQERKDKINMYIKEWQAVGFRSPAMHHNLEWIKELNLTYDLSTFDTDPFEPQADGVETIFPFWVDGGPYGGYVEMPYTLPQDFTPFILMKESTINIWKRKLDWIVEKGGMALLNVHPDYFAFSGKKPGLEEFPAELYEEFLTYIKTKYANEYWHGLPKEMACFWKSEVLNHQGRVAPVP